MTDGPSLQMTSNIETNEAPVCLNNFAAWLEWQDPTTYAGLLDLIGNALYRHALFAEGNDVKDVVARLREGYPFHDRQNR